MCAVRESEGASVAPLGTLGALAALLDYPGHGVREGRDAARTALRAAAPEVAHAVAPFLRHADTVAPSELEELYARTFDWSPKRCLELGWHLYGENYDRGTFLVRMRGLLQRAGVEEAGQLPDHLGRVLLAVERLPREACRDLVEGELARALAKLLEGFAGGGSEETPNPYRHVLEAVRLALATRAAEGS